MFLLTIYILTSLFHHYKVSVRLMFHELVIKSRFCGLRNIMNEEMNFLVQISFLFECSLDLMVVISVRSRPKNILGITFRKDFFTKVLKIFRIK